MRNYLYDFVLAIIINKEKNIIKFYNEIVLFCQKKNFLILCLFDKSRDLSTVPCCMENLEISRLLLDI